MNSVLLVIILSVLFLILLIALSVAIIIVAWRRINRARAEAEAWQEIARKANKRLEEIGFREIEL